jgi:hypothetical protein
MLARCLRRDPDARSRVCPDQGSGNRRKLVVGANRSSRLRNAPSINKFCSLGIDWCSLIASLANLPLGFRMPQVIAGHGRFPLIGK